MQITYFYKGPWECIRGSSESLSSFILYKTYVSTRRRVYIKQVIPLYFLLFRNLHIKNVRVSQRFEGGKNGYIRNSKIT